MIDYPFKWDHSVKLRLARELWDIESQTETVKAFLSTELKRMDKLNRTETNDIILRHRQGACQVLSDLIGMVENSREMHKTLKEAEGKDKTGTISWPDNVLRNPDTRFR